MTQAGEILIGSPGGDHVSIRVRSFGYDREGWNAAEVEVHCDGWTGRMGANFMKGELGRFAQEIRELGRNLTGTAEMNPLEPNLTLTLVGDGKGHVAVDGVARNHFDRGTELVFHFGIDQTFLADIAKALSAADSTI
jgi:hypothetical protein